MYVSGGRVSRFRTHSRGEEERTVRRNIETSKHRNIETSKRRKGIRGVPRLNTTHDAAQPPSGAPTLRAYRSDNYYNYYDYYNYYYYYYYATIGKSSATKYQIAIIFT
eukprot:2495864-Pyramimonas_sp.AAC.2